MSNLTIERVTTRRQKKAFLQFPWTLYRDDPNWIPRLRIDEKELTGIRPHPFYARNAVQTFLAYRGGEVQGRIAAILDQGYIARYDDRRGFFGFFDCRDDEEAAHGLFDAARRWFADQDIHRLRGPANPSLNYEVGLLVDGFDSPPTFMMTYNPPYYERLIESYGFRKTQDLYAFWGNLEMLPKVTEKLRPVAEQIIERYNVKLRTLDTSRFREDVEMFLSVYNRSLVNTWGFVPMSPDEMRHLAAGLRYVIIPEMAVAAEIDGRVVGATFGLPDYNPRIKEIKGRLFPFGFIHLLRNRRAIRRIRLISTNVLPEYQRFGIGLVLMYGVAPRVLAAGVTEAEFSWVLESNSLSYGALKKGGAKITKTYRLYDLDEPLAEPAAGRTTTAESAAGGPSEHSSLIMHPSPLGLEIREVRGPRDLDRFIKMPWPIYAEDPHWVPPLLMDVKEFLDRRKHPFYQHGEATQFLALRGEQVVGRILVSDDPRYNEQQKLNAGAFGMFECANDRSAAHGLLDAAADWLRGRGRDRLVGPLDYSTNYPCGLLIEGFDTPPRIMMNHHRRYYAGLLESWGLKKATDLYAWWFVDPQDLLTKWKARAERLTRSGRLVIRPFRRSEFAAEVARCQEVYNAAMVDLWGAVKLTDAEFLHLARRLNRIAVPEQVLLAEFDGRVVGVSITLPDINEAIRPLNGRLAHYGFPSGLIRLRRYGFPSDLHVPMPFPRRVKTARMVVLDVLQDYRRRGIAEMLIFRTLDYGKNVLGYTAAELSWTMEANESVNHTIRAVGARRYKTYRIYEKPIGGGTDAPFRRENAE